MKEVIEYTLLISAGVLFTLFQISIGASTSEIILIIIALFPAYISIIGWNRKIDNARSAEKVLGFELDRRNPYTKYG